MLQISLARRGTKTQISTGQIDPPSSAEVLLITDTRTPQKKSHKQPNNHHFPFTR
jgi:hypothetical protein